MLMDIRASLRSARFDAGEWAGALGDLGTFLPLLLGMSRQNGLDFGVALFFAGLLNLLTGLTFRIPMAVQPMKAIAAVALTQGLSVPQILAAGMAVSAMVLLAGATGLAGRLAKVVPADVVRGLQLALGLQLAIKGLELGWQAGLDRWWLGVPALILGWWMLRKERTPVALLFFGVGLLVTIWRSPQAWSGLHLGLHLPRLIPISPADWNLAFWKAAVPQLPVTLLNSVVAVCALSRDLFPEAAPSERKVAVSVGLMNLLTGWFGGMPMCHGAGGLAGQARFGARTQGSILILGSAKLVVAVAFGASLMGLAQAFPAALLGVMLLFSGLALAESGRKAEQPGTLLVTTAAAMALGFLAGVVVGCGAAFLAGRSRQPA
jgi:MFS superfamily sulfate permease-like transporter